MYEDIDDIDEEFLDTCIDSECACKCHAELWDDLGYRFEAGVLKIWEDDGPPYDRRGVFPFLKLPGEIREKIYSFSFLQYGKQRKAASHRGSIHTALLGTCRQIYNEARHLPLTINKLCFSSALSAHDFLGFFLAPTQKYLVTSIHIEFHMMEFPDPTWQHLVRELAKMPITHLGLTIRGGVPKEQMLGHTCFTNRFKLLKGLKTIDLVLASAFIKAQDKKEIQEEMRETLIKDYRRSKLVKMTKPKRAASTDLVPGSRKATKKAKKANTPVSSLKSSHVFSSDELTLLDQTSGQDCHLTQNQPLEHQVPEGRARCRESSNGTSEASSARSVQPAKAVRDITGLGRRSRQDPSGASS